MRDDDLGVALGTKSARLKQGLEEEHATLIHVQTRFDIVKSIRDTVDPSEEIIVIEVYRGDQRCTRKILGMNVLSV